MKISLVTYCLLNYFEAIYALYPASVSQINSYGAEESKFQRRAVDQEIKPFNITLNCSGAECKKVSDTFDRLSNILSSFIQIKNQIKIEVSFESHCKKYDRCEKNKYSAVPYGSYRTSSMKNKEGLDVVCAYSLGKQFAKPIEIEFDSLYFDYDFDLDFNSDVKYWFEGDGNIEPNQPNFFLLAAKELITNLGIYISIGGYDENGSMFVPSYTIYTEDGNKEIVQKIEFNRNMLDSLLVTTSDGKSFNTYLDPYINFKSGNISVSTEDIPAYLKKTPLIEASKKIEKLATTPDSLAIKLPSGKSLILETSIQPYDPYRSLGFISESKYLHTKEALLTSKVYYGEEPLPQEKSEDWPTYPFGPLLIETLELLGYTLKESYKNSSAYLNSDKDEDKSNNKSDSKSGTNNSSISKANICLLFTLLSLYLFN